jgi:hypothetical protein
LDIFLGPLVAAYFLRSIAAVLLGSFRSDEIQSGFCRI